MVAEGLLTRSNELVDGRFLLVEFGLVLRERWSGRVAITVEATYDGHRHGGRSEETEHKRELGKELHVEKSGTIRMVLQTCCEDVRFVRVDRAGRLDVGLNVGRL